MHVLVALLLRLFPGRFRSHLGPDLLATFDERWRERAGWRLAARTIDDMIRSACLEQLSELRARRKQPVKQAAEQGDSFMRMLWQELRFGTRTLVKSPGFTVVALLTLALGIGATSAIYSVVDSVLFKGLPYPHADRLVFINEALPKAPYLNVSWPDFVDWRAQNQVFAHIAAFQPNQITVAAADGPKAVPAAWVSSSFFSLVGAKPILGRTFGEQEDKPGAPPVVVLSYRFWRNELKADPNVAGKQISTAGNVFVVAGVLAPDFEFRPWEFDLYVPVGLLSDSPGFVARANHPGLQVLAEIRSGVSLASVRADMDTIMSRLGQAFPASNRDETVRIVPIADRLVGNVRTELLLLLGAVLFVLLIACANVAHLALARATGRQQEFAVRTAIGANRGQLIRQVLAESMLLSFAGGTVGLFLAYWSVPLLTQLYPRAVPGLKQAHLDSSVVLVTLSVCVLSAAIFGLAPVLQVRRAGLGVLMRGGGTDKHSRRIRSGLFVVEIAIAIVVTVGAGLLIRSLAAVLDVNPGFRADHLLALDVVRSGGSGPSNLQFFEQAVERIARQPGVQSAAAIMCPPLTGTCWSSPYGLEGQTEVPATQRPWTALNMVTPAYFQTAAVQLIEGRLFDKNDDASSKRVAIINQTLARRLGPKGGVVGKRLDVTYAAGRVLEVAGIVADVKQIGLETPPMPEVYVPVVQMPVNFMTLVVRTSVEPESLMKTTVAAIRSLDKNQPVSRVTPMLRAVAAQAAQRRFAAILLGLFSLLALLLAAVGVSGVMAYTVAQRTREFGIRLALGAQRRQVLQLVLKDGFRLTVLGMALGVGSAWGLVQLLRNMLFEVQPHDAISFAAAPVLLGGVALVASLLPARRAARVDPMRTLRHE